MRIYIAVLLWCIAGFVWGGEYMLKRECEKTNFKLESCKSLHPFMRPNGGKHAK